MGERSVKHPTREMIGRMSSFPPDFAVQASMIVALGRSPVGGGRESVSAGRGELFPKMRFSAGTCRREAIQKVPICVCPRIDVP